MGPGEEVGTIKALHKTKLLSCQLPTCHPIMSCCIVWTGEENRFADHDQDHVLKPLGPGEAAGINKMQEILSRILSQ